MFLIIHSQDVSTPQTLPIDDRPVEDLVSFIEGPADSVTKPSKKKKKSKIKENQVRKKGVQNDQIWV